MKLLIKIWLRNEVVGTLEAEASDTIAEVKQRIIRDPNLNRYGEEFRLILMGRSLCDDFTMRDYNIQNDSILHVTPILRSGGVYVPLSINLNGLRSFNIRVNFYKVNEMTFNDLKQAIHAEIGIPLERQCWLYEDKQVDDDNVSVGQFCAMNNLIKFPPLPPFKLQTLGSPWIEITGGQDFRTDFRSAFRILLDVELSDTIEVVNQKIQDQGGIPIMEGTPLLIWKGVRLDDYRRTLQDYNIQSGTALRLFDPNNPFLCMEVFANKSTVYYIVDILFHKFIYMDFDSYYELIETLQLENLFEDLLL